LAKKKMTTLAKKRSNAKALLRHVFSDPKRVLLIHYACEDFANRPDGSSARITSIAVRHLDNALTYSFSTHLSAEKLKIKPAEIKKNYDQLETAVLSEFSEFCAKHLSFTFVHWNMRDTNYGFPAIYHRSRMLEVEPNEIPPGNLVDLARTLVNIYGANYIGHPRLPQLLELNNISTLAYVGGEKEAEISVNGDFVTIHRSTLRKVDCFESIITRAHSGSLKTLYKWRHIYANSPKDVIFFIKEHWIYSLILIIMLAIGFGKTILPLVDEATETTESRPSGK
jgi:hypothetical protein